MDKTISLSEEEWEFLCECLWFVGAWTDKPEKSDQVYDLRDKILNQLGVEHE